MQASTAAQPFREVLSPTAVDVLALTAVDDDGFPVAVLSRSSSQYLTGAPTYSAFGADVLDVSYSPLGFLSLEIGPPHASWPLLEPADAINPATARTVTIDKSVVLLGLDRAKFVKNDALFVSAALQTELQVIKVRKSLPSGRVGLSKIFAEWRYSIPVPVDTLVLRVFQQLMRVATNQVILSGVDRTDLLCAATAIVYDSPLYTTKPEAYAEVKNGLRVLEYRAVRNKAVVREREKAGTIANAPAIPDPLPQAASASTEATLMPLEELHGAFERGATIDGHISGLFKQLDAPASEIAKFVERVLSSLDDTEDPAWRIAVLERAQLFAPAVAADSDWHGHIIDHTSRLCVDTADDEPLLARQANLAFDALGIWGRWPEDVSHDILVDLAGEIDEPGEPEERLIRWYRVFLQIAGLSADMVDHEMAELGAGRSQPSMAYIESLRQSVSPGQ